MFIGRSICTPDNFKSHDIGKQTYKVIKKYLDRPIKAKFFDTKITKYPTALQIFIGPKL